MKALLLVCVLNLSTASFAADRIVKEWDFSNAADTLGWSQTEPIKEFKVADGALVAVSGPGKPKLESPVFELPASPRHYIEIELKTDAGGTGMMYYSNATEEPYHGFRPPLCAMFGVTGDNRWHTYIIRPFWQKQGKIIHIRIDPPGENPAIRAVRIIEAAASHEYASGREAGPEAYRTTVWEFRNTAAGWQPLGSGGNVEPTPRGLKITGDSNLVVLSPPLETDTDRNPWAVIRLISDVDQLALLRWASDNTDGLQTAPFMLKGDGRPHSYPINLADVESWSGKVLALGVTPAEGQDVQSITLQYVAIGDKPLGPPEIKVMRFGLDYPIVRVGQKTKVIVEVKNTGGTQANEVAGLITLVDMATHDTSTMPVKRVPRLAPGESTRFEWEITAKDERERLVACRVTGVDLDAGEQQFALKFHPKLGPLPSPPLERQGAGAKYVPEPAPVDTGPYLVGCYYFPGWHTYDRWSALEDFPERRPVLGWYREGDPEVADWQISWALSHGIGFFIHDWYWSKGARRLEHALHDAFLKSRYQDRMKFCLLWANHNPPNTSSEEDCLNVTRYWIENYLRRPNYLKVDGKNVMVIFSPHRLTQDMGSDAVKVAFDKMRKLCEESGVGGLYLVACTYPGKDRIEPLIREGYDALSGYNYPAAGNRGRGFAPYEWMVEGYKDYWNQIADLTLSLSKGALSPSKGPVPYIPVCEPGWDARPWHGYNSHVRTGKSPALWEQMLENARSFVDDHKHKQGGDKKLVFLNAWNEFGEGDYIEPHARFGFEYLDAIRRVFAPKSRPPAIVVPPDVGLGPYDVKKPEPRTERDFSDPARQDDRREEYKVPCDG